MGVDLTNQTCSDGFRVIVDQCLTGIIVQIGERVVYANRAALDCLGFEAFSEVAGRPVEDFLEPKSYATLACNFRKIDDSDVQLFMGDLVLRRKSGAFIDAEIYHAGIRFEDADATMINFRDVTATKKMELELRRAQKLESIGRLAAGVAHEINTPIQYIGDSAHFLAGFAADVLKLLDKSRNDLRQLGVDTRGPVALEELREEEAAADLDYLRTQGPQSIARILDGVTRVARIVAAMKSFSHPGASEATPMDINKMLTDTLVIAGHELKNVGSVETEFAVLPLVTGHPADLNQALLNLVINSAHALTDRLHPAEPGVLKVGTRVRGDQVEIFVGDNGCGMPPEVQARLFEPFFTTKEVGRGTGQGLVVVRAAVEKNGGTIEFESSAGVGTTFTVRLPITPGG